VLTEVIVTLLQQQRDCGGHGGFAHGHIAGLECFGVHHDAVRLQDLPPLAVQLEALEDSNKCFL
jgi:hypothetical protein